MNRFNTLSSVALLTMGIMVLATQSPCSAEGVPLPHYTGRVTPTPQKVLTKWRLLHLQTLDIQTASDPGGAIRLARELMQQRVNGIHDRGEGNGHSQAKPITVILGTLDQQPIQSAIERYDLKIKSLVLPPEGYAIRVREGEQGPVVIATGGGSRGAFYAGATLIQMMGMENGRRVLKMADLNDWPKWQHRYVGDYPLPTPEHMQMLALYKINGLSIKNRGEWRNFGPDQKPRYGGYDTWRKALGSIQKFNERTDLFDIQVHVNIYSVRGPRKQPKFDTTREKDVQGLIDRVNFMAKMGVDRIMIQADDWTPSRDGGYVVPHESERKRFGPIAGEAHGYLMRRLDQGLKKNHPAVQLGFCPAPYSIAHVVSRGMNETKQKEYLRDLAVNMPDDIPIIWTGPQIRSYRVGRKDYLTYKEYVLNHPLYLFANPAWSGSKGYTPFIFRCDMRFYDGLAADSRGIIYLNGDALGKPWKRVYAVNANDYLWNPDSFATLPSHRDAVEKLHGEGTYPLVLRFMRQRARFEKLKKNHKDKARRVAEELKQTLERMEKAGLPTRRLKSRVQRLQAQVKADLPRVDVPRFKQPPEIDGHLDEPVWRTAGKINRFQPHHPGRSVDATTGLIGYDHKALYLGFMVHHNQPLKDPVGVRGRHDAKIWNLSDAIEIFLRDGVNDGVVTHLVFDHNANQYDESKSQGGARWNPAWKVAVSKKAGVWRAETRIPFASLEPPFDQAPDRSTAWTGNFCRSYATVGQLSSWSSTFGGSFHETGVFGRLNFQ